MRYQLTCKNCELDHTHETDNSMGELKNFWNNWNKTHEKNMKCVHEYEFRELK